jgi:hypothetical protein
MPSTPTPTTPPPLPPMSSRDITSARRDSSWTEPETPTQRDRFDLSDLAPIDGSGGGAWQARSPSPSPSNESVGGLRRGRRQSDMSALSADLGLRYTYVSHLLLIHPSHLTPALARFTDSDSDLSALFVRALARIDVGCPYSVIRRFRPRTLTRTKTCSPRCKIRVGEVSSLAPRGGLLNEAYGRLTNVFFFFHS